MSLFDRMLARCPICDTEQEIDLVGSVNAGRRPDLREQILARRFQEQSCVNCGALFRLPPGFTYVDYDRGQWILAHPADQVAGWQRLEAEARAAFDSLYGPGSGAEEVGRTLRPRITFGWPALREKIACNDAGLDDVELELSKLAVLRNVSGSPVADETELRFDRAEADALVLHWTVAATESVITSLRLPRSVYGQIAADTVAWADLRGQIGAGRFVDYGRILLG